jgi:hypothetical protein
MERRKGMKEILPTDAELFLFTVLTSIGVFGSLLGTFIFNREEFKLENFSIFSILKIPLAIIIIIFCLYKR